MTSRATCVQYNTHYGVIKIKCYIIFHNCEPKSVFMLRRIGLIRSIILLDSLMAQFMGLRYQFFTCGN